MAPPAISIDFNHRVLPKSIFEILVFVLNISVLRNRCAETWFFEVD